MLIQVKLAFAITELHNFIQLHQTISDIYNKAQLNAKKMAMCLAKRERQVAEKVTQISININKSDGVRITCFKDEIAEAIWQDYISTH